MITPDPAGLEAIKFFEERHKGRIGTGEYVQTLRGDDTATLIARDRFLLAVRAYCPVVLGELEEHVFPKFQAVRKAAKRRRRDPELAIGNSSKFFMLLVTKNVPGEAASLKSYRAWMKTQPVRDLIRRKKLHVGRHWEQDSGYLSEWNDLQMALISWATKYGLLYDWIIASVITALNIYASRPKRSSSPIGHFWGSGSPVHSVPFASEVIRYTFEAGELKRSRFTHYDEPPPDSPNGQPVAANQNQTSCLENEDWQNLPDSRYRFVYCHEGWMPLFETKQALKASVIEQFEGALREFLREVEEEIREQGFTPTGETTRWEHFDWLALRLTLQTRTPNIVAAMSPQRKMDDRSVKAAIARAARRIQIEVPPLPSGRPRGKRKLLPG